MFALIDFRDWFECLGRGRFCWKWMSTPRKEVWNWMRIFWSTLEQSLMAPFWRTKSGNQQKMILLHACSEWVSWIVWSNSHLTHLGFLEETALQIFGCRWPRKRQILKTNEIWLNLNLEERWRARNNILGEKILTSKINIDLEHMDDICNLLKTKNLSK